MEAGLDSLRDGSNQLSSGADALYNGFLALNNGAPALVDGIFQLKCLANARENLLLWDNQTK